MRHIAKIKKKKIGERFSFDRLLQLWFNYHFFFFQSLIFRGLKLRAFALFISIKAGLKSHKFLDVSNDFFYSAEDDNLYDSLNYDFLNKVFSYDDFLLNSDLFSGENFYSGLKKRCSFTFIWFYFQFFFIKNLFKFFYNIFFFKIYLFKNFFFFYDSDFFFLSFLKFFFVIWFCFTKRNFQKIQLKIFFYINFFQKVKSKKISFLLFTLNYINFFQKIYIIFLNEYFFTFKSFYFFKQLLFCFFENKWRLLNLTQESLFKMGLARRIFFWNNFFSFFLIQWIFQAKKLKIEFFQQDSIMTDKPVFDPSFIFFLALLKITPILVLKPLPLGSVNYEMPFPITYWKRISFSSRWIINLLKKKDRVISLESVVSSIIGTLFEEGHSIEKKNEVYALVSLNRHLLRHKIMRR